MATIHEERPAETGARYVALVRLKGHAPQSRSFERKTDAKDWAQDTEARYSSRGGPRVCQAARGIPWRS